MSTMPELDSHPEVPLYDIVEFDPLLDSADMLPDDWEKMARTIEKNCEIIFQHTFL